MKVLTGSLTKAIPIRLFVPALQGEEAQMNLRTWYLGIYLCLNAAPAAPTEIDVQLNSSWFTAVVRVPPSIGMAV